MRFRSGVLVGLGLAAAAAASSARGATVDITTAGNLLALEPVGNLAASSVSGVATGLPGAVNNRAGTSGEDDGLVFGDTDTNQRLAITGFNSAVGTLRLFASTNDSVRLPPSLTVYYSTASTTSLVPTDASYVGPTGGVLVPTMLLTASSFNHAVPGSTNGYIELAVAAPVGTRTLLFAVGSAAGGGDRIGEVQAFVPEPGSCSAVVGTAVLALRRRRRQ